MATMTSLGSIYTDGYEVEVLVGEDNSRKPMIAIGFSSGLAVTRKRLSADQARQLSRMLAKAAKENADA